MTKRVWVGLVFVLVQFAGAQTAGLEERSAVLERGRTLTGWFYERNFSRLYGAFSAPYKAFMNREQLTAFRQQVEDQAGSEVAVEREGVSRREGLLVYTRTATFGNFPGPVDVTWGLDASGEVASFAVTPQEAPSTAAPSRRLDYRTKTALQLPVAGFWHVVWGGRTVAENYHAAFPDQRFALDVLVTRGGSSYRGGGTELSDYYCFGRPLYAPGVGVVVDTVSDLPDLDIGQRDTENIAGNYVIIDHQNGEFSFLGHLRQGSLEVAVGERVRAGDPVGRCGNSGNTTEPHLHYQLQAGRALFGAEALPAQFLNYTADGRRVVRSEPVRGQMIER